MENLHDLPHGSEPLFDHFKRARNFARTRGWDEIAYAQRGGLQLIEAGNLTGRRTNGLLDAVDWQLRYTWRQGSAYVDPENIEGMGIGAVEPCRQNGVQNGIDVIALERIVVDVRPQRFHQFLDHVEHQLLQISCESLFFMMLGPENAGLRDDTSSVLATIEAEPQQAQAARLRSIRPPIGSGIVTSVQRLGAGRWRGGDPYADVE